MKIENLKVCKKTMALLMSGSIILTAMVGCNDNASNEVALEDDSKYTVAGNSNVTTGEELLLLEIANAITDGGYDYSAIKRIEINSSTMDKIKSIKESLNDEQINLLICEIITRASNLETLDFNGYNTYYNKPDKSQEEFDNIQKLVNVIATKEKLQEVNLNSMDISDISEFNKLTSLETLSIINNPINDFSSLIDLKNLKTLYLDNDNVNYIDVLQGNARIR